MRFERDANMAGSMIGLIRSRRLWPITVAQSCGALNDNLVKNAMVVLAIFRLGVGGTGLSALAGALFIAPYILLSATAGTLADRFAKPRLIRIYKIAELLLMIAAAAAFLSASIPALLAVLVGLGIQAALFGPVKYGVLPEYLADNELIGGNGIIEATTFLSIVCGTVAGGFLMLLPSGTAAVGAAGIALSLIGLFAALQMPSVPPANPSLALRLNIISETWLVCRAAARIRPIWLSVLGLSWFWTMGATLMTEFPIIARDTMGADGSVLTLLLSTFAIGVGIGSIACARLLHGEVSARFVPFAALGISVFCWDFASSALAAHGIASASAVLRSAAGFRMLADLLLLAACGGGLLGAALRDHSAGRGTRAAIAHDRRQQHCERAFHGAGIGRGGGTGGRRTGCAGCAEDCRRRQSAGRGGNLRGVPAAGGVKPRSGRAQTPVARRVHRSRCRRADTS